MARSCPRLPCLSLNLPTLCPGLTRGLPGCAPALPTLGQGRADFASSLPAFRRHSAHARPSLPTLALLPPRATAALKPRGWVAGGGDRIGATWAESQWIVAARPLCHLQYPVAYLSRLQRILPAARWEFLQGVPCDSSAARVSPTTRAFGGRGPYCWSANGRRAHASLLARILT